MPHGSGGGSHSGGSHSSSHSSSHGGSHGGSHGPRMSRKPFPHCRRFRYYDRYGMSHYMYSEAPPQPQSLLSLIITLFFFAPFVIAGAALVFFTIGSMLPPKPLTQDYISNGIYIEDNAYVLDDNVLSDDMTELNESLRKFKELTGIEPHIITVYDSDWENHYNSLENYAYDLYVNRFSDEKHFLIVYSEPENAYELEFVDWSWEGMQGDDTDSILTTEHFSIFQSDLQRYLTMDEVSVTQAFTRTFNHSLDYIMKASPDYGLVFTMGIFSIFWIGFVLLTIISTIKGYINSRRNYEEVPMDDYYSMGDL